MNRGWKHGLIIKVIGWITRIAAWRATEERGLYECCRSGELFLVACRSRKRYREELARCAYRNARSEDTLIMECFWKSFKCLIRSRNTDEHWEMIEASLC